MSRKYKFHNPDEIYFVFFAVQGWVDMFTHNEYKNILLGNLDYCRKYKGLGIFAWSIISNHEHLVIRVEGDILLPNIFWDYKKFTSKAIINAIYENHQESRNAWLLE